jgi:isocitrate lyase
MYVLLHNCKFTGHGLIQPPKNGEASYTYGCLEPTMLTQMAKYLDTVYVSGWQSSSTASASDEPGPDLADYPYVGLLS